MNEPLVPETLNVASRGSSILQWYIQTYFQQDVFQQSSNSNFIIWGMDDEVNYVLFFFCFF